MIEKLLTRMANDLSTRILVTGTVVLLPTAIALDWLSAVFHVLLWDEDFLTIFWQLLVYGGIPVYVIGFACLYAIERWIIRERAKTSFKWGLLRVLLFMAAGVPEGFGTLVGIRWGMRTFPPALERFYFVQTVVMSVVMGLLYTLVERAMMEVQKRESRLKRQIQELRIEINELKRREDVDEISGSDFFQELQQKAARLRGTPMKPAEE